MARNSFEDILGMLDSDSTEKTASENAPQTESTQERLLDTVKQISQKTASADASANNGFPTADLEKMAKAAHESEQEKLAAEAFHLGSILADGFMTRFAQYETALDSVKTAMGQDMPAPAGGGGGGQQIDPQQLDPQLLQLLQLQQMGLLDQGGASAASTSEEVPPEQAPKTASDKIAAMKHAAEEYARGYEEQIQEVHKIASDLHVAGQEVATQLIQTYANS